MIRIGAFVTFMSRSWENGDETYQCDGEPRPNQCVHHLFEVIVDLCWIQSRFRIYRQILWIDHMSGHVVKDEGTETIAANNDARNQTWVTREPKPAMMNGHHVDEVLHTKAKHVKKGKRCESLHLSGQNETSQCDGLSNEDDHSRICASLDQK